MKSVPPRTLAACGLGLFCFALYLSNVRVMGQWDSIPARMLPFSILLEGDLDLDEFRWLAPNKARPPYFMRLARDGRTISGYPIATPLLVTPLYVPAAVWVARAQPDFDDSRFRLLAVVMERVAAAAVAAVSVSLVFLSACTMTRATTAAAVALLYGLGTSVWCVSSQALWQHGAAQMALAGMCLGLLRPPSRRTTLVAAVFAALAFAVRPTLALFVAPAALVVWLERRRDFLTFAAVVAAAVLAVVAYNLSVLGIVGGGYQTGATTLDVPTLTAFAGLWVSPNRGLLIYTPAVLLAFAHPFLRRAGTSRWLDLALLATLAYSVFFSAFRYWWAGYNFGPRYMIDPLPVLALGAIPAVEWLWRRRARRVLALALAGWCLGVQVLGVYFDGDDWNARPFNVNKQSQRLWDWHDNQIRRTAGEAWHGGDLWPLLHQTWIGGPTAYLRRLRTQDLASEVMVAEAPAQILAGQPARFRIQVVNRGEAVWPVLPDWGWRNVRLSHRWYAQSSGSRFDLRRPSGWQAERISLGANLAPDEARRLDIVVPAPQKPGRYRLEISATQGSGRDKVAGLAAVVGEVDVLP